jgi:hypothetical protein
MGNLVLTCSHELWFVESPFGKGLVKVEQKKYTLFERLDGSLVSYFVSFMHIGKDSPITRGIH